MSPQPKPLPGHMVVNGCSRWSQLGHPSQADWRCHYRYLKPLQKDAFGRHEPAIQPCMTKLTHSAELMAQFGADPAVRDSERHKRAFRCVSLHVFYCAFPSARRRARPAAAPPPRPPCPGRTKAAGSGAWAGEASGTAAWPSAPVPLSKRTPRKTPHFPRSADCGYSRRFRHLRIAAAPGRGGGATCEPGRRESPAPQRGARPLPSPGRARGGEAAAASPSRGKRPAPAAPGTPGRGLGGAAAPRGAGAAPGGGRRGRGARAALPPVVTVSRSTSRRPLRSQHGGADGGSARLQWGLLQGTGAVQGRSRAGLCVPRWEQGGAGGRERSLGAGPWGGGAGRRCRGVAVRRGGAAMRGSAEGKERRCGEGGAAARGGLWCRGWEAWGE